MLQYTNYFESSFESMTAKAKRIAHEIEYFNAIGSLLQTYQIRQAGQAATIITSAQPRS